MDVTKESLPLTKKNELLSAFTQAGRCQAGPLGGVAVFFIPGMRSDFSMILGFWWCKRRMPRKRWKSLSSLGQRFPEALMIGRRYGTPPFCWNCVHWGHRIDMMRALFPFIASGVEHRYPFGRKLHCWLSLILKGKDARRNALMAWRETLRFDGGRANEKVARSIGGITRTAPSLPRNASRFFSINSLKALLFEFLPFSGFRFFGIDSSGVSCGLFSALKEKLFFGPLDF